PSQQHPGRRPAHGATTVDVDDLRTVDLEVVVVLRVDGRDDLGLPRRCEVLDDRRGALTGVVPPLEGGDDDRVPQLTDVLQLDHGHLPNARRRPGEPACDHPNLLERLAWSPVTPS